MSQGICFAGLDVHARKTACAAVQLGSGEVWKAQLSGSSVAAIEWLQSLPAAPAPAPGQRSTPHREDPPQALYRTRTDGEAADLVASRLASTRS